jgi:hypothetical protein
MTRIHNECMLHGPMVHSRRLQPPYTSHRPRAPILPIRPSLSASGDQNTTARPGYDADEDGTSTTSESSWYVPAAFWYKHRYDDPDREYPP